MSVTLSDKRRTVEYDFGYGALLRYPLAVAEAYGVKTALLAAIMPPFSDKDEVFIEEVEEKVPDEIADFLFACDAETAKDAKVKAEKNSTDEFLSVYYLDEIEEVPECVVNI